MSAVSNQVNSIQEYASKNKMKLNFKKTNVILFNPSKNIDFIPDIRVSESKLENVEEIKLLGVVLRSDMKWTANTDSITEKSYKRLWVLQRLKVLGASTSDLVDVFVKQVRPVLEYAVPVWHSGITQYESDAIERVQKAASKIILQDKYKSYCTALKTLNLQPLQDRREKLCTKFALQAEKHPKFKSWFKVNNKVTVTRNKASKYCPVYARTNKFEKSPVSYLTMLLNSYHEKNIV